MPCCQGRVELLQLPSDEQSESKGRHSCRLFSLHCQSKVLVLGRLLCKHCAALCGVRGLAGGQSLRGHATL